MNIQTNVSIALRDLQILADIGVYHHEIGRPQPLILDVILEVIPPKDDLVSEVFDYVRIKSLAEELSLQRFVLIEMFAQRLAEGCLKHPLVLGAEVTVAKPFGVPGAMASTTVKIGTCASV